MSRKVTRRTALGVLGTGFAALAGATTRPSQCAAITGSTSSPCGDGFSLSGPESVSLAESNPQFVATSDEGASVTVDTADWSVYRRDGDWKRVAAGSGGASRTLAPGEQTAWIVIDDDVAESQPGGLTTTSSTRTRYVGPVPFTPGEYAFAVSGSFGGDPVEAVALFTVE